MRVNPVGGSVLDQHLQQTLQMRGVNIAPHPPVANASVASYLVRRIVREMKVRSSVQAGPRARHQHVFTLLCVHAMQESVCKVSEVAFDAVASASMPNVTYELPDGTKVAVGAERYALPELIFDPTPLAATLPGAAPLQNSLLAAAMACEPDVRRELVSNLVLSGAVSALTGIGDRVLNEFAAIAPPGMRPRMASAYPAQRAVGAWLGGSILGSLGTFHDMWFSADEYAEYGVKMIHRKCP